MAGRTAATKRIEDRRLLEGRGEYLDDIVLPRILSVVFVRSPHAHALIVTIDGTAARQVPGALVVTGADLVGVVQPLVPGIDRPGFVPTETPPLASGTVRFCGEAVAAVAAPNAYLAADAREGVVVEYEALSAVTSVEGGLAAGQVLFSHRHEHGDAAGAFANADVVLRQRFGHGRCAPSPLEPRGIVAAWDGDTLTAWASTQRPHVLRRVLARACGVGEARVRVIVPDVGGAFGLKAVVFPEDLAVAGIARLTGRPVKWVEERRENLVAAPQAREQVVDLEVAADRGGRLLGLRARFLSDAGAYHSYPQTQALEPMGSAAILPGPYRVAAYSYEVVAVATNKPPIGGYRGVGMVMGVFAIERALDMLADRLDLDPAEIRERNLLTPDEYPFTSSSGLVYDSGDLPRALRQALRAVDYQGIRRAQATERREGRWLGVGLCCYTESTGMGSQAYRRRGISVIPGPEALSITIDCDATVRCVTSQPSQGQGQATVLAQLVADRLTLPIERIRVERVDTMLAPPGSGTMASRGAVALAGLAERATDLLRRKIAIIAGQLLEASPDDIVLVDGQARVRGVSDRGVDVAEIAGLAYAPPIAGLPDGLEPGLTATVSFDLPGPVFSGGVHVAVVEVDRETGRVRLQRHLVVEDCGRMLNPVIVDGQIHGGVAQGFGEALLEELVYGDDGQPLTATLMDYGLPRAADVPAFDVEHIETPSPLTPLGVKGMGEGGTIGAPAAIANAVADAVRHLRVPITALPIRAEALRPGARASAESPTMTAITGGNSS